VHLLLSHPAVFNKISLMEIKKHQQLVDALQLFILV
jgi:hypothetical protein